MPTYKDSAGTWRYRTQIYSPRRLGSEKYPDGKIRLSGTPALNTKLAAKQAEVSAIALELNPPSQSIPTFQAFADTFLAEYGKRYKASQLGEVRSILRTHLLPVWGEKPITDIRTKDVRSVASTIGPARARNVLTVISKVLKYALGSELISVMPLIERPKAESTLVEAYEPEAYEALLGASAGEPYWYALLLVGGDCGLRAGEIFGLQWANIDFDKSELSVTRSVWHGIAGTPKSRSSKRTIPMSNRVIEALRALPSRSDLIFRRPEGFYLTHGALRHAIKRLEALAGLPKRGKAHMLRHTFGSTLANRGAPVTAIKELMGHTSITTTMRYMHATPAANKAAIALLNASHESDVATSSQTPSQKGIN